MQLYNFDNWYLEGISILMTIVSLFTIGFFISGILKDRNNSKYPVWKYFLFYVVAYAICRSNFTFYEYRSDILLISIFLSCFLFSNDKLWKKILVPFIWSISNLAVNASANFIMMKRCGLTFNDFDTMSYEALLAIFNKDVYANFCIQAYTYTALAFIEIMILLFINRKKVKSLEIFLIDLFVFILVAISNISMYFMGNSKFMPVTGIVSFFASIFIMVYSYSRLRFYQEYSKTEAENKFLKEKEIMQLDYYNEMKVKEEKIRKISHDIKNNISVVYGLKSEKEREKFIKKIDDDLRKYELVKYSSNDILNIILNTKISKARNLGIKFDIDIKSSFDFMEDIDVSNLFTNILDNAIENSFLVDDKFIKFSIKKKLGNIVVECSNSYDGIINYKGKRLKSRKNDEHGFGLKIIDDIVKKYNGEIKIDCSENFTITLLFLETDK